MDDIYKCSLLPAANDGIAAMCCGHESMVTHYSTTSMMDHLARYRSAGDVHSRRGIDRQLR